MKKFGEIVFPAIHLQNINGGPGEQPSRVVSAAIDKNAG
jgi:hypothetical protein